MLTAPAETSEVVMELSITLLYLSDIFTVNSPSKYLSQRVQGLGTVHPTVEAGTLLGTVHPTVEAGTWTYINLCTYMSLLYYPLLNRAGTINIYLTHTLIAYESSVFSVQGSKVPFS